MGRVWVERWSALGRSSRRRWPMPLALVLVGALGLAARAQAAPAQFRSVSSGAYHTCGVRLDDTLACWGLNLHGQARPPAGKFRSVSAGVRHTCGVRLDDTVACWGSHRARWPKGQFGSVSAGGDGPFLEPLEEVLNCRVCYIRGRR